MRYYFAPMEGVTGAVYRRTHHEFFPGVDKYYMPFITPTTKERLTPRQRRDVAPEVNEGVPSVPQILTKNAADFIWAANALWDMGYEEINLNLGCPSGTVTAKGKGAGFLAHPEELDRFLDAIFSSCKGKITVKTRLGMTDPSEFARLLEIYNGYPIAELTIHPRVRQDFYKGKVRESDFAAALPCCRMPVCYNGDIVTEADARAVPERYPAVQTVMIGRALIGDPSLVTRLCGGVRAACDTLEAFHNTMFMRYCEAFGDARVAVLRMKEIWFYHLHLFENSEKYGKRLRKAVQPADFTAAAAAIFRDLPLREQVEPAWFH